MTVLLMHAPMVRRWLLLVAVAGMPLIVAPFIQNRYDLPKFALLTVVVVAAACLRLVEAVQGEPGGGLTRLALPIGGLALVVLVSWASSQNRTWALFGSLERMQGAIPYVVPLLLAVLVADAFAERRDELAWALFVGAVLVAIHSLIQAANVFVFSSTGSEDFIGTASTLANPNFAGAYLAMSLPVGLALWWTELAHRRRLGIAIGVVVAALGATISQGPWGAALAGLALTAAVGFGLGPRVRVAAWVVVFLIPLAMLTVVGIEARSNDPPALDETAWQRSQLWTSAARMVAARPVFGWGSDGYPLHNSEYRTREDAMYWDILISDDPHSLYLSILIASGALGAMGFGMVMVWIVLRIRSIRGDPLAAGFAGCAVAYLIVQLVSIDVFTLRTIFLVALAGMALPIPEARKAGRKGARQPSKAGSPSRVVVTRRAVVTVAFGVVISMGAALWALDLMASDLSLKRGIADLSAGRLEEGVDRIKGAVAWWNEIDYRSKLGQKLGGALVAQGDPDPRWIAEIERAYSYLDEFPKSRDMTALGELLDAFKGSDPALGEKARRLWFRALELDPRDPVLRIHIAGSYIDDGEPDEALRVLAPLSDMVTDPRIDFLAGYQSHWPARYWGTRALALARLGEHERAREAARLALELDPEDPNALAALETPSSGP